MQTLKAGEILGWSWIFPPYKWHFDARATEDSEVIAVDGVALRQHCDEHPALGYALVKHFASFMMERLNASRRKVMDLYGPEG
jgi:CRP-like cAMP-binding protein